MANKTEEANASAKLITHNFKIRKNIPLDSRFIISSISNIDIELPLNLRYNGLIFFVEDAIFGTDTVAGKLYCFEADLTTPILLSSLVTKYLISFVTVTNNDYSNILTLLNQTYPYPGKLVLIKPLGITVMFDGTSWKYFAGNYSVDNSTVFNTIPVSLREKNRLVIVNGNTQNIILANGSLSPKLIVLTNNPPTIEEDRWYSINGILFYGINNTLYRVGEKITFIDIITLIGKNRINHGLGSSYVLCFYRINNTENLNELNTIGLLPCQIIDNNQIDVNSGFSDLSLSLIIISKI